MTQVISSHFFEIINRILPFIICVENDVTGVLRAIEQALSDV